MYLKIKPYSADHNCSRRHFDICFCIISEKISLGVSYGSSALKKKLNEFQNVVCYKLLSALKVINNKDGFGSVMWYK